jgi:hypothetical protein
MDPWFKFWPGTLEIQYSSLINKMRVLQLIVRSLPVGVIPTKPTKPRKFPKIKIYRINTYLGSGFVALLHGLIEGLLLEGDLAALLKVLLADLLLGRLELGHVGEVALLGVLVRALQDGILLERGHLFLLVDAAEPRGGIVDTGAEVNAAGNGVSAVAPQPCAASVVL